MAIKIFGTTIIGGEAQRKEAASNTMSGKYPLTNDCNLMKSTIEALVEAGLREKVKIIIGGAPVTKEYADEIGADGYAPDAGSAVELARSLKV